MPSYTDIDSLKIAFKERDLIRLTNDDGTASSINADVVNESILLMSDWIDSYLRQRYLLPLSQIPEVIRNICNQMTFYELKSRVNDANDTDKFNFQRCLRLLNDFAAGNASLPGQTLQECANLTQGNGPYSRFTRRLLDKM